jgi:hypothetical protein
MHGLMFYECCLQSGEGVNTLPDLCGNRGGIWFVGSWFDDEAPETPSRMTRRDFVVVEEPITSEQDSMYTIIHEIGHVLNAHHCEYGDPGAILAPGTVEHLDAHRTDDAYFFRPGPNGAEFCDITPKHMTELHAGCNDCGTLDEMGPVEGAGLRLAAEKDSYLPGEPFRVSVTLAPGRGDAAPLKYYGELSLEPTRGYLWLWVGKPDASGGCDRPGNLRKLAAPAYIEPGLDPVPLDAPVSVVGIDAWASLPVIHDDICIQASYAGFEDRSWAIRSNPITIRIDSGGIALDRMALADFTAAEARRVMFFFGGDHLQNGLNHLEAVSAVSDSPYKPYADLVLGMHLARPWVGYDAAGSVQVRPADPEVATGTFLDPLWNDPGGLPPSYLLHLNDARAVAHEDLGDAAAAVSPPVARLHYEEALRHRQLLATPGALPRPPFTSTEEAKLRAQADLARVQGKLAALPPP